jgi:hypothetical protein
MLGLSDKRRLSRSLGIGLVLAPLFFLLDTPIDPAWPDDDAAYLAEVGGHEARHAAGMVTFGLIGLTTSFAFSVFDLAMAHFGNREAMVHLHAELGDSFAYKACWLTFLSAGTVLGLTLLAVALLRQRLVALWSPILLIVASVFWHVAGGERVTDALALLMLAAALAPLAARIWSLSDEDWELWEIGM